MLTLAVRFLAGRYHATPWGMHVNEGAVEWPPSPWRIARALVAAGFTRIGWREIPPAARALFARLAEVSPRYALPLANAAHTRHYMPLRYGTTTKVIDAFAHVADGVLGIEYDVELSSEELLLVDSLLAQVPYLGRAESWIEIHRVENLPDGLEWCLPSDVAPGPRYERIELLAPERPSVYAGWRTEAVAREVDAQTIEARRKAEEKGKSFKGLSKKDLEKVEALFPRDVVDALLAETPTLQKLGWSQPPGSRWISYYRREGALRATPAVTLPRRAPRHADTALLALSSDTVRIDVLPPMDDAIRRMEVLHKALVMESCRDRDEPSPCFTGNVRGKRIDGHQHATLFPLNLGDRSRCLDHVLVYAPMGFDDAARKALGAVRKTYATHLPDIFVVLAGLGERHAFESVVPHVRRAMRWESATPFVASRYLKPRGANSLDGQVRAELRWRGLPDPQAIEIEIDDGQYVPLTSDLIEHGVRLPSRFRHFKSARAEAERRPPSPRSFSLRVTFAEPIAGPISLGYASHFGLGAFVPASAERQS